MAIQYDDVIRHEDSSANLIASSRAGQTTYETDGNRRQLHSTLDGSPNYWTPDDKFSASIPTYTNITYPAVTNVTQALDAIVADSSNFGRGSVTEGATFPQPVGVTPVLLWNQVDEALYAGVDLLNDHWVQVSAGVGQSGFSGYSGTVGGVGPAGPQGYSGISGYSGIGTSGYSGIPGAAALSGYSGSNGLSGYSGVSGFSGANPGASGYSGNSGFSGANPGASGYSGASGIGSGGAYAQIFRNATTVDTVLTSAGVTCFFDALSSGPTGITVLNGASGYSGFQVVTAGTYDVSWTYSFSSNTNPDTVTGFICKNSTAVNYGNSWCQVKPYSTADKCHMGASCKVSAVAGDYIFLHLANAESNTNSTHEIYKGLKINAIADLGSSGYSGAVGVSGYSGYSGQIGTSGYSGKSGFSGYSGISGFSGHAEALYGSGTPPSAAGYADGTLYFQYIP